MIPASLILKDLFRRVMEVYLKNQQGLINCTFDWSLKVRNLDLYYGNYHIEYYYFCRLYEKHFDIEEAKSQGSIPFAAFFPKDYIFYWLQ